MQPSRKTGGALAALAALGLALARPAAASPATYTFTVGGFSGGGTLDGTFTGTPEADGSIQYNTGNGQDDLTALAATFSGNGLVPAGSVGLGDVQDFFYGVDPVLGVLRLNFYATNSQIGVNPDNGVNGALVGEGNTFVNTADLSGEDESFRDITVTRSDAPAAVPEPGAVCPFALGGLGVGGLALRARRRRA